LEDSAANIWVGTSTGVFRIEDGISQKILLESVGNAASGAVRAVLEDSEGMIWIGTDKSGIYTLNDAGIFSPRIVLGVDDRLSEVRYVRELKLDAQGNVWVATFNKGVYRISKSDSRLTIFDASSALGTNRVRALLKDDSGDMWIGTDRGLHFWNSDDRELVSYLYSPGDSRGITDNIVYDLYQDRGGIIWAGTYKGVSYFNQSSAYYPLFSLDGLDADDSVSSFAESSTGIVAIGTHSGLVLWNPGSGQLEDYGIRDGKRFSSHVMSLSFDSQNQLWVGTFSSGVFVFNDGSMVDHFVHDSSDRDSLSSDAITDIFLDREGEIWVSTYGGGVNRYDQSTRGFQRFPDQSNPSGQFGDLRCFELDQDIEGNLWIGTNGGGVVTLNPNTGDTRNFSQKSNPAIVSQTIVSLLSTGDGIWMGSLDSGLSFYDFVDKSVSNFSSLTGHTDTGVYGLLEGMNDGIWISNGRAIYSVDRHLDSVVSFDQANGVQQGDLNHGADLQLSTGFMIFGGNRGVNVIDPRKPMQNKYLPPVRLTAISVNDKSISVPEVLNALPLQLDYFQNSFRISFSALDYTYPSKNQYKYKLGGFDREWIDNGTNRSVNYTNLDPGSYMLRVQGSNSDGAWNEVGLSVPIVIRPPVWATWWAYILYAGVALFLFYQAMTLSARRVGRDAEHKFNRRLQLYVESLDETAECVFNANKKGRLLYSNSAAGPVLGKSPTEVAGHSLFTVLFQDESDAERAREMLDRNGKFQQEVSYRMPDGEQKVLEVSISRVDHPIGDDVAFVCIARDVTDRSHQREALEERNGELVGQMEELERRLEAKIRENRSSREQHLESLSAKEALLRDIHDRVNDNFQMLMSLLNIQASKSSDENLLRVLGYSQQRLKTVALAHENLSQTGELRNVGMGPYIDALATGLYRKSDHVDVEIQFKKKIDDFQLDIDQAIPCALIITELLTNALDHAFVHKVRGTGSLGLEMYQSAGECVLVVSDDGQGLPKNLNIEASGSMGMEIVSILTEQLDGHLKLVGGPGTTFELRFPILEKT
jgi:PAS domain S-box-containing protein